MTQQCDDVGQIEIPKECRGKKIRVKLSCVGADGSWKENWGLIAMGL